MGRKGSLRTYRCPPDHPHGKNGTCYSHGCGCEPCTATRRVASANKNRNQAYGRPTTTLVDAGPTLAKIAALRAAGWSYTRIGDAVGVRKERVRGMVVKPVQRVAPETETAFLGIQEAPAPRPNAIVDGTGTRRRVQALVRIGHPIGDVAALAGLAKSPIVKLATKPEVGCTEQTRQKIAAVYERLWATPPEDSIAKSRAIGSAVRRGWHGPLAWIDVDIDDPDAQPEVDEPVAEAGQDDPRWVLDEVDHLRGLGESPDQVAVILSTSRAELAAIARWHRRSDLAHWVAGTTPPKPKKKAA